MTEMIAKIDPRKQADHLDELDRLFERMDRAYLQVADRYGFVCNGCEQNCCLTLFYHHTILEYLFIKSGYQTLAPAEQAALRRRAGQVLAVYDRAGTGQQKVREMCPLNREGRCRLYRYRPMICRLHGVPHQLCKPGGMALPGPGCAEFEKRHGRQVAVRFDRTPFYIQLADLERRLRNTFGLHQKIKMTVAEMIATF
jgi:Fe-S-cluster containining protein